jgi:hypothetical protein
METLKYLRHVQRTPFSKLQNIRLAPALVTGIEGHVFSLLENLFEGHLRSINFLRRVRGY